MRINEFSHSDPLERRLRWRAAVWFIQRAIRLAPDGSAAIDLEDTIIDWLNRWAACGPVPGERSVAATPPGTAGNQALLAKEAPPWAR